MAYLGNANPREIFPQNTIDTLVPDPGTGKVTFVLSQEVPGGYEGNVLVIINNVIQEPEVAYTIGGTGSNYNKEITIAEVLQETDTCYVIHRGSATYNFVPSPASVTEDQLAHNLREFTVDRFDGDGIETEFVMSKAPVSGKAIMVSVDGVVQDNDDISTAHTGDYRLAYEADLNFTTNPGVFTVGETVVGSVSSAEGRVLSQNADSIRIMSTKGSFTVNEDVAGQTSTVTGTLLATGAIVEGDHNVLQFHSAPAAGTANVRVVHLGFSTVSRRAALSEHQIGSIPANAIGTPQITDGAVTEQKLATSSVAKSKVKADAIDGAKILLSNTDPLRILKVDGLTAFNAIWIDVNNNLLLNTPDDMYFCVNGTPKLCFFYDDAIWPANGTLDLGRTANKFRHLRLSGNIEVDGTVDGVDIAALNSIVSSLSTQAAKDTPVGSMMMWPTSTPPTDWLVCNGAEVSNTTYPALAALLGTTWGTAAAGKTKLPDLRQRMPIGWTSSGAQYPAGTVGTRNNYTSPGTKTSLAHTHTFSHSHNLSGSGSLTDHKHTVSDGQGHMSITYAHTHKMTHVHNMTHGHMCVAHHHGLGTLAVAWGGGHSHTASVSYKANAPDNGARQILPEKGKDGEYPVTVNFGGEHSHGLSGRVGAYNPADPNWPPNGDGDIPVHQHTGNTGGVINSPRLINSAMHTDYATGSVSVTGSTDNVVRTNNQLPTISISGSTNSQSTSTTPSTEGEPLYAVVNMIIKAK